ncbi:D-ribose-binding periplasmic protein precursor [Lacunisphaera limnophila]|uniref:D-ribose-binding periplasmic protein n=2 Tax=Lacunisphaera limnophila TaxID=1838286 RepID=A0A1D8ATQ5_9BACT|nr:D-ribose-binding periplasmic protein precursor [Lacunisphaera limnophila]
MKLPHALCLLALIPLTAFSANEKIAVIPKGTTHSFWKSVEAGARQAGAEFGVEILWKGPLKEDDRAQQIGVVQQFVSSGVDAIVLAPLDDTALRTPVKSAADRKIPVVIFDSALKGEVGKDFLSYVATNNFRGGEIGGTELVRLLGGKGKVVLLRYAEGSASTAEREAGFLSVIKQHPGITLIVENRYAGATISSAQDAAMNLIDKIREADGLFCPNESSTQGMLLALRQTGLAGKKTFVGFDTSPFLLTALERGQVQALVAQNPTRMGYLGVATAVKHLRGEKVEATVDTGCVLVTKENRNTPEVEAVVGK